MPHCQTSPDRLYPGYDPFLCACNTALWEFQVRHQGHLPSQLDQAVELEAIQGTLISERIANKTLLKGSSKDLIALVQLFQYDRGETETIPHSWPSLLGRSRQRLRTSSRPFVP